MAIGWANLTRPDGKWSQRLAKAERGPGSRGTANKDAAARIVKALAFKNVRATGAVETPGHREGLLKGLQAIESS